MEWQIVQSRGDEPREFGDPSGGYRDSVDHLVDELHRIELLVQAHFTRWKEQHGQNDARLLGLVISDEEVESILQKAPYYQDLSWEPLPEEETLEKLREVIEKRKMLSLKEGSDLRFHTLSNRFGLSSIDRDILLICLVPELDLRYEKIYAFLQDDLTRKRPTVNLVINLLCRTRGEMVTARNRFSLNAPLMKNRLLLFQEHDDPGQAPLLARSLKVDERVVSYLLGSDNPDSRIRTGVHRIEPEKLLKMALKDPNEREALKAVIANHHRKGAPLLFSFTGPYGTGKKTLAEAICREMRIPLLVIDLHSFMPKDEGDLAIITREGILQDSALYFDGCERIPSKDGHIDPRIFLDELDRSPLWIFLAAENTWQPPYVPQHHTLLDREFPVMDAAERRSAWLSLLRGSTKNDIDYHLLASSYHFSYGQIRDAFGAGQQHAETRGAGENPVTMEDLIQGCRAQSNRNLKAFARYVIPHATWDQIILPSDSKAQLREICERIRFRGAVLTEWGFDRKFSLGKGVNILFTGPSGTGKTMAAEIIAREVGLEMYQIDLSSVVSKYIGETEKNLQNIFREAETSNAILFFDEADALFGKRSEVRDSHDRYANIEINYLLQKMEEHQGIVILASNFKRNIDEAFMRRMHFAVEFPMPDERLREAIWRGIYPKETPLSEDLDYSFLAKFKIPGGNIKNIALGAAFLAASDGSEVKMEHIIRATKREFQKMGKLCTQEEFGRYYPMIKE